MLEAYDGGPQRVDRIKRGHVYVPNWSVVVAGNIQPRRLAGMAENLIDDGLFQRFLTIHTRPALLGVDDDRPIAPKHRPRLPRAARALATLKPVIGAEGKPMPCFVEQTDMPSAAASCAWSSGCRPTPRCRPSSARQRRSGPGCSRAVPDLPPGRSRRAASQGASPSDRELCRVTGATVTMAATFLRRIALPNLFRLGFETLPEEGAPAAHARWIAGHILAHGAQDITAREIGRAYSALRGKPGENRRAMDILVDAGWAVPANPQRRPALGDQPGGSRAFRRSCGTGEARRAAVGEAIKTKVGDLAARNVRNVTRAREVEKG